MGLFGEKLPNIPAFMVSGKDGQIPWRPVDRSGSGNPAKSWGRSFLWGKAGQGGKEERWQCWVALLGTLNR